MAESMAQLAADFTTAATGILDASLVNSIANGIQKTNISGNSGSGTLNNEFYYMRIQLFTNGRRLISKLLFINDPSNTGLNCTFYSNNFTTMYSNTIQAYFLFMPTYTAIIMCDATMNYLGQMQTEAVITPGYTSTISNCLFISP